METAEVRKEERTKEKVRRRRRRRKTETYCEIRLLKGTKRVKRLRKKKIKLLMFLKVTIAPK